MEHAPVIHVIIPVYEAEKYIAQTLDSVLCQPYPNIKIICVDDGSPDDSISILREYEKRYHNIHVIRQKNAGVSAARNKGIEYVLEGGATGYIAFLDADDLWTSKATESLLKDLDGDLDCVGYSSVRCNEDLTLMAPPTTLPEGIISGGARSLWCHSGHPFAAVLYSCSFLKSYSIRFLEGLRYAEDQIFKFTCFYLAKQIRLVNRVVYCYRINSASAMHHRKYGTDYRPDIIRGYLKTAEYLLPYENEQRGSSEFCNILSGINAIEMTEEHYQKFRSGRKLAKFFRENPDIAETIDRLDRNDLSDNHQQLYDLYHGAPLRFRLCCYRSGISVWLANICKKLPFVVKIWQQRQFYLPNKYL